MRGEGGLVLGRFWGGGSVWGGWDNIVLEGEAKVWTGCGA